MDRQTDDELAKTIDALRSALEHIAAVCKGSRQCTRRIRWLEARARSALAGDEHYRTVDLPKHEPGIERLQTMIVSIFSIVLDEIEARRDVYEGDDGIVDDEKIRRELELLERFVADCRHSIQLLRDLPEQGVARRRQRGDTLPT